MTTVPSNKVTWFQLPADDVDRAWRFYGEVFGWRADEAYSPERQVGAIPGEIAARSEELQHPRVVVRVDDVDQALAKISAAGGKVTVPRTEIPEIGMVYASFMDTEGNALNVVGDL